MEMEEDAPSLTYAQCVATLLFIRNNPAHLQLRWLSPLASNVLPYIHQEVLSRDEERVLVSLMNGHNIDAQPRAFHYQTPLHLAVLGGLFTIAGDLIDLGADLTKADFFGATPLHIAIQSKNRLCHIFKKGPTLKTNKRIVDLQTGDTPSLVSVETLHTMVENIRDEKRTLEQKIIDEFQQKHNDFINSLLERKANINAGDKFGLTPLYYALLHEEWNLADLLIDYGATIIDEPTQRLLDYYQSHQKIPKQLCFLLPPPPQEEEASASHQDLILPVYKTCGGCSLQ